MKASPRILRHYQSNIRFHTLCVSYRLATTTQIIPETPKYMYNVLNVHVQCMYTLYNAIEFISYRNYVSSCIAVLDSSISSKVQLRSGA